MCVNLTKLAYKCALDSAAKAILVALADRASKKNNNRCWPSIADLKQRTGYSERTIQNKLNVLIKNGHITRILRTGTSSLYHVHPKPPLLGTSGTPPQMTASGTAIGSANPRNDCGETIKEPKKNPDEGTQINLSRDGPAERLPKAFGPKVTHSLIDETNAILRNIEIKLFDPNLTQTVT